MTVLLLEHLADLRLKYEEMLRLRLLDEAGATLDPRCAMAALAGRFPGALREIDELPMEEIRTRIHALRAAETDRARELPWMRAIARFHALTRGALSAKRWLAGRKIADVAAFTRDVPGLAHAKDARAWESDLGKIARPPRGRITDLVFARLAIELGLSEDEARHLVFGTARRKRLSSSKPGG